MAENYTSMRLTDGRQLRSLKSLVSNQKELFGPVKLFNPKTEGIATLNEAKAAFGITDASIPLQSDLWFRTAEYVVCHRDPTAKLGKRIAFTRNGIIYTHMVPDVPVSFGGTEISLQKVVGMAVYPSIGLLKLKRTGEHSYAVQPVSLDAIAGKVRAMNFMRNGWALPDEHGFPDGSHPSSRYGDNEAALFGSVLAKFSLEKTNGWHGSIARPPLRTRRHVCVGYDWNNFSGLMLVGTEPARQGV
jgi:hypothetical protein